MRRHIWLAPRMAFCAPLLALVEVKCPYRCQSASLIEVASQTASSFKEPVDGDLQLRRNHSYYYQVQMGLYVTQLQTADFVVWTPSDLYIERIQRDEDLLHVALLKLEEFYSGKLLPALFSAAKPAPRLRLVEEQGVQCAYLPWECSQSRIEGRNGSSACTLIATHVVRRVLAESMEQVCPSKPVPRSVVEGFIDCMKEGNCTYDAAQLGGQLLSVYDALDLMKGTGLVIQPRGDIGCRSLGDLITELLSLCDRAAEQNKTVAGILVQTPFSASPCRSVSVYDSHSHGADGALIARSACSTEADSQTIGLFISGLIGVIRDCHVCIMLLNTSS